MTRRRQQADRSAVPEREPTSALAGRLNLALLLVTVGLAFAFAWLTRHETNPDGAAYLDLARALREGRVGAFVQGYWSPLYPAVLAALSPATTTAHVVNAGLTVVAAALLYRALQRSAAAAPADPTLATRVTGAWSAFIVAACVLVRISAVTPDAALLLCIVGWAVALSHPVPRWLHAGIWLGLGFLAKTSLWPWMLATVPLLLWRRPAFRSPGAMARYLAPAGALFLVWVLPLSLRAGHPTIGVTGALNACWFLRECDGQSPDTHAGVHRRYQQVQVPGGAMLRWVPLDPAFTYQPWSDPDGWAAGVVSQRTTPLTMPTYARLVANNVWQAARFSLSYVLIGAVLAMGVWWSPGRIRAALDRPNVLLLGAGILGVSQFVAVQAVTRTLAPFVFLVGWAFTGSARPVTDPRSSKWRHLVLPWIPLVVAAGATGRVWGYERSLVALSVPYAAEMRDINARASRGFPRRTVVVVGRALPLMALASQLDARIVGQIPPDAAAILNALPLTERRALLQQMAGGQADVAWELDASAQVRVLGLR